MSGEANFRAKRVERERDRSGEKEKGSIEIRDSRKSKRGVVQSVRRNKRLHTISPNYSTLECQATPGRPGDLKVDFPDFNNKST